MSPESSQDETSRSKRKFEAARMEGWQPGADAQATTTTRGHFEEEIFLKFSLFRKSFLDWGLYSMAVVCEMKHFEDFLEEFTFNKKTTWMTNHFFLFTFSLSKQNNRTIKAAAYWLQSLSGLSKDSSISTELTFTKRKHWTKLNYTIKSERNHFFTI